MESVDLAKERIKLLNEISRITKEIAEYQSQGIKNVQVEKSLNKSRLDAARKLRDVNLQIKENQKEYYIDATTSMRGMSSLASNITILEKERISLMQSADVLTDKAVLRGNDLADINRRIADLTVDDYLLKRKLQKEFNSELIKLKKQKNISADIVNNLKNQNILAQDISSLTETQKAQLESQIEAYDTMKKTVGGILDTIQLLASKSGIGLATIALGQVVGRVSEVNKQFGMTLFSADGVARKTALMNVFFDDAVGTTQELASQFGSTEAASFRTQLNTNLMAMNLGISGKEAATLVGSFARLNGGSVETANNLIASTKELAKQRGVIPSQVMADLANNTEAFALYAKNGGQNISQASVFARQLGVEMSTLVGITDNLLDFETSITKELELSAMLGRNINLNQARQLAYAGDIEGATKETLQQLGGIDEFNRMDVFQKRAAAELLGVNVAQLQQMVELEAKANTEVGMMQKSWSTLNESATALTNVMGGPFLSTLGSGLVALGQMGFNVKGILGLEKLRAGWAKITSVFRSKETKELAVQNALKQKGIAMDKVSAVAKSPVATKAGGGFGRSMMSIGRGISVFSNPKVALGLAAITAAIIGIGFALKIAAPGIEAFGTAISSVVQSTGEMIKKVIEGVGDFFMKVSSVATPELALSVLALAGSFATLSASLATFSIAGIAAIPAMTAVSAFGTVGSILGLGQLSNVSEAVDNTNDELLREIKGLRKDLNDGKVAVYMDGRKVTASVSRVVDRIGTNSYNG